MVNRLVSFNHSDILLDESNGMLTYSPVVLAVSRCVKGLERMGKVHDEAEE